MRSVLDKDLVQLDMKGVNAYMSSCRGGAHNYIGRIQVAGHLAHLSSATHSGRKVLIMGME